MSEELDTCSDCGEEFPASELDEEISFPDCAKKWVQLEHVCIHCGNTFFTYSDEIDVCNDCDASV